MLAQLGVEKYTSCQEETVRDAKGAKHSPVGKVDLRWHKKELAKSHAELFRVVDDNTSMVILGATAFPQSTKPAGASVKPIGVTHLTAGLHPFAVCFLSE